MANYYATVLLTRHWRHPPSYPGTALLRADFDEARSPDRRGGERQMEHDVGPLNLRSQTVTIEITEAEYESNDYRLFLWADPLGSVAFHEPRSHDGLAVGRLILTRANEKRRGAVTIPVQGSGDGDRQVYFEVAQANSVPQYMADEMNTNSKAPEVTQIRMKMAQVAADRATYESMTGGRTGPRFIGPRAKKAWMSSTPEGKLWKRIEETEERAEYDYGHLVHKDEGFAGFAQDIYFLGGGQWDHKPRIRPIWGTDHRLGNTGAVYFYDIWSNMHFGYVGRAAGIPLDTLKEGAGKAQFWDSGSTTGDDIIDAEGVEEGYNLYGTVSAVTVADLMAILARHSNWANSKRYPNR